MRVIFAGTPEFAARSLQAVISAGYPVPLVLTQPDRPAGRGMKPTASPVKQLAAQHGLAVAQPPSLKDPAIQDQLRMLAPDVMVVAAYGLLLPAAVLSIPPLGCINVHASLLPRWRGAAPIQRALLAGDAETGVSIMQMDAGLDTGSVWAAAPLAISRDDTAGTLHDKLAVLGANLLLDTLPLIADGKSRPVPQDDGRATYAAKLAKREAVINWALDAEELGRAVRAYSPFPVASTSLTGEPLRIWRAEPRPGEGGAPGEILDVLRDGILVACGTGRLLLQEVQKAGGKRMGAASFVAGNPVTPGTRLGS